MNVSGKMIEKSDFRLRTVLLHRIDNTQLNPGDSSSYFILIGQLKKAARKGPLQSLVFNPDKPGYSSVFSILFCCGTSTI